MKNALVISEVSTNKVMTSMVALFVDYAEKLEGIRKISDFVRGKDELINYFFSGSEVSSYMAEKLFEFAPAKAALDAEFWSKAINMTDVLECMSADKRNEWSKMIRDQKTPDFTKENVFTTISNLLGSRGSFLAEKVDGIFRKLSGNHVTNSPQGFRKRMIISYVLDSYGFVNHNAVEYLHDLRSVIAKIQGRDEPKTSNTRSEIGHIARAKAYGEWHEFDGGAFKVRLYKIGTAHMEIHPSIAIKLNQILAQLHPMALATESRKMSKAEKSVPLMNDILPYEVTACLAEIADSVARGRTAYFSPADKKDLSRATLDRFEEVMEFLGAKFSKGCYSFPYDAGEVLHKIIRTGCLPEKVSHQFYPTPDDLAVRVVRLVEPRSEDKILEPSAGHGALAAHLPKGSTTCVEVNPVNSEILKQKGFNVICADFLKWEPGKTFNKIVMNPPFAKGEAERHVRKASELLQENGIIVAIVPASLRNKTIVKGMNHHWSEVITGAFDGTNVSVAILELTNQEIGK